MKQLYPFSLIWLLVFCILPAFATQAGQPVSVSDSLKNELLHARHDSDRVPLLYQIGMTEGITRIAFWDSLINEAHKHNMKVYESRLLKELGKFYYNHYTDFDRGEKYFIRSISVAEESNNPSETMAPLACITLKKIVDFNMPGALEYCFKGLKTAETLQNKLFIARFYYLLARIYYESGELGKALKAELQAYQMFKEINNHKEAADALLDIGTIYVKRNDKKNAIKYYLESEKYIRLVSDPTCINSIYCSVGAAYDMKEQFDMAAQYYQKGYTVAKQADLPRGVAGNLVMLAENKLKQNKLVEAEKYALEALRISKSINFTSQLPSLYNTLKQIFEHKKDFAGAYKFYQLYVSCRDSASNESNRKLALQKEFDYSLQKKENENKLLAQQNQIQTLKLSQSNYLIAGLLAGIIFIFAISFLFIRQNRLRAAQQNMQMEQKLLRSQMNPHFIFNSLQAIQNYILKQESTEAVKYLSSFANITRAVLESSRMDMIPLQKEITLLENYLQLQKLRFANRFDYEIFIDENVDVEQVSVPPMLSQPFIENAVEHGMQGIEDGGKINVSYSMKKSFLNIEITDNGWGMNPKNQPAKKNQSLAIEITRERVTLMNKKKKQKTVFTITEAFPLVHDRKGVKVSFLLPLQSGN